MQRVGLLCVAVSIKQIKNEYLQKLLVLRAWIIWGSTIKIWVGIGSRMPPRGYGPTRRTMQWLYYNLQRVCGPDDFVWRAVGCRCCCVTIPAPALRLSATYVNKSLKNWLTTGSTSYMRVHFVETCFGSRCLGAKSLLGFDWTCVGIYQKRINIKIAIIMAATMTFCSNAILAEESIQQILHL